MQAAAMNPIALNEEGGAAWAIAGYKPHSEH